MVQLESLQREGVHKEEKVTMVGLLLLLLTYQYGILGTSSLPFNSEYNTWGQHTLLIVTGILRQDCVPEGNVTPISFRGV